MENQLQYKYDQYDQDFHPEPANDKNTLNVSVQHEQEAKVPPSPSNEDKYYEQDFIPPQTPQTSQKEGLSRLSMSPGRQKMIEQNIKLKTQIYELAKQMDQIIQRERKGKKYGIHADQGEEDQTIKTKKTELKKQQIEIMNLKNKIFLTKRQLEHVYDARGVQGKEDELKNLQKQLKTLQDQKQALLKVKKEQSKALKMIRNDQEYEEKVKNLKQQLTKVKDQCKQLNEKLLQNERVLRKNHQIYITKQAKIKEMQAKIKQNKDKSKKQQQTPATVTPQMLQQLDVQIADLQKERKQTQKSWNQKIQNIENQLAAKRLQEQKKLLILKQKQKELKLNEIRIKQLKKLIHHTNETQKKPAQSEGDPKEFRNRRNIKHLQK